VAALVVIEALSRQIPGVVGLAESVERDSFRCGWLDHPHYTRPREVEGSAVPPILLSGDHARIERWRRLEALRATLRKRPDLIGGIEREGLDAEERRILAERVKELSGRSGSS
jgi:tRNA (guanine37-N1)-methyltransferase